MTDINESFDSSIPTSRNDSIETMIKAIGLMSGKKFHNVQAHSTEDGNNHFITFDHDGAKEIHIMDKNLQPFFTGDSKSPMKVFGTAINLVKSHADSGNKVRLVSQDEPESIAHYSRFADRAKRLGYNVEHIPSHEGSSGVPVVAWEISKKA
jgi:hypothetical protein